MATTKKARPRAAGKEPAVLFMRSAAAIEERYAAGKALRESGPRGAHKGARLLADARHRRPRPGRRGRPPLQLRRIRDAGTPGHLLDQRSRRGPSSPVGMGRHESRGELRCLGDGLIPHLVRPGARALPRPFRLRRHAERLHGEERRLRQGDRVLLRGLRRPEREGPRRPRPRGAQREGEGGLRRGPAKRRAGGAAP